MFFVLKKIFSTSYLTPIFFLLEKGKLKKEKNQNIYKRTNFLVTALEEKGILFPVNIFFNLLLHCYASLILFELFISIYRNSWVLSGYLYYM